MMEECLFCVCMMRRMFRSFVKGFSVKDFPPIRLNPCYNSLHHARALIGKGFSPFYLPFAYKLSTKSFAYNLAKETCRLFLHGFRVMRVKILRNGRILVAEAGGYVDGLCSRFDQSCGMCVSEAVSIELLAA